MFARALICLKWGFLPDDKECNGGSFWYFFTKYGMSVIYKYMPKRTEQ